MEDKQPINIIEGFQLFHTFINEEPLKEFAEKLTERGIDFKIEEPPRFLTDNIIGISSVPGIIIKLLPQDFERAHKVLGDYYETLLSQVDEEYYLFGFSDNELFEILEKPDEWGYLDYQLAKKLLADRGKNVDDIVLAKFRQERIKELAKPNMASKSLIVLGYCFFIFTGIISILVGRYILQHRKTLPNGEIVFSYSEQDKRQARRMIRLGIVTLVLWLSIVIFRLLEYLNGPW